MFIKPLRRLVEALTLNQLPTKISSLSISDSHLSNPLLLSTKQIKSCCYDADYLWPFVSNSFLNHWESLLLCWQYSPVQALSYQCHILFSSFAVMNSMVISNDCCAFIMFIIIKIELTFYGIHFKNVHVNIVSKSVQKSSASEKHKESKRALVILVFGILVWHLFPPVSFDLSHFVQKQN